MKKLYFVRSIAPVQIDIIEFDENDFRQDNDNYYVGNNTYPKLFSTTNPEEVNGMWLEQKNTLINFYQEKLKLLKNQLTPFAQVPTKTRVGHSCINCGKDTYKSYRNPREKTPTVRCPNCQHIQPEYITEWKQRHL